MQQMTIYVMTKDSYLMAVFVAISLTGLMPTSVAMHAIAISTAIK